MSYTDAEYIKLNKGININNLTKDEVVNIHAYIMAIKRFLKETPEATIFPEVMFGYVCELCIHLNKVDNQWYVYSCERANIECERTFESIKPALKRFTEMGLIAHFKITKADKMVADINKLLSYYDEYLKAYRQLAKHNYSVMYNRVNELLSVTHNLSRYLQIDYSNVECLH